MRCVSHERGYPVVSDIFDALTEERRRVSAPTLNAVKAKNKCHQA